MTKRIFTFILVCLAAGTLAATSMDSAPVLPVLRISVPDPITKDMDYSNGRMRLTDEDGNEIVLPAQFKTRGSTAKKYMMKPSLNMKLRTVDYSSSLDSALLGLRINSSYILDAMAIDRICMRNRVGFDVWNAFSRLPYQTDFDSRNGTEGRFVELYINDTYYGIYCLTDKINRKLLGLKKPKEDAGSVTIRGVLYKSGTSDIANQNERGFNDDYTACTVSWHNAWELSEPDDYPCQAAWQPLLDAYDQGQSMDYIRQYFYLEQLAEYQVFIMALSIIDDWGNKNRYLSIRNIQSDITDTDGSRRFVVTPWDLDTDLGGQYDGSCYDGKYTDWRPSDICKGGVYPFSPLQGKPEYVELMRQAWIRGREGAFSIEFVRHLLYGYRDLFVESGAWDRMVTHFDAQRYRPCYVEDLGKEIDLIMQWYEKRFAEMDAYFNIPSDLSAVQTENSSLAEKNHLMYDLLGRAYSEPTTRGVYIDNGKKIIVL